MCRVSVFALALASVLAAACGDDGGDTMAADAAPVADAASEPDAEAEPDANDEEELTELERLCAPDGAVVGLYRRGVECTEIGYYFEIIDSQAFAPERLSELCSVMLGDYVADGTLSLNDDAVGACLEWLETAPCELIDLDDGPPSARGTPCDDLMVGGVDAGGSCEVTAQCAGDAFCNDQAPTPVGAPAAECGECTERAANGSLCDRDETCSSGYCTAEGVCAGTADLGDGCTTDDSCAGSLQCDTEAGICVRFLPHEGMSCTTQGDCGLPLLSLYCDLDGEAGTCKRLPAPGEACLHDVDGSASLCDPGNYVWCSPVDDTCKEPTITDEGQPCHMYPSPGAGALRCADGLACTDPMGTSEDGRPLGVCYRPGTDGDACELAGDGTDQCRLLYACRDGVCALESEYTGMCPAPEMP